MRLFYFIPLLVLCLAGPGARAQTECKGSHSAQFILAKTQNGVDFYFRINHCTNGDEVLLQLTNTTNASLNVTFTPRISSANQQWTSENPYVVNIPSQTSLSPASCQQTIGTLSLPGYLIFPNEFYPQNNSLPQLLEFEFLNTAVNP